jgi:hypothetical protein
MNIRRGITFLAVLGGVAALAPAANAACVTGSVTACQDVTGIATDSLALAAGATPPAFGDTFQPGDTFESTVPGTVVVTTTRPKWTLKVSDENTTSPGVMDKAAANPLCATSASDLGNPVDVSASGLADGNLLPAVSLGSTAQTIAQGTAALPLPLAAEIVTTNYSQTIDDDTVLATGCTYSVTATFTLAAVV